MTPWLHARKLGPILVSSGLNSVIFFRISRSFTLGGALLAALLLGPACATTKKSARPVSYTQTAASNYKKGMVQLKDESFAEASKYFNFVKNRFPFSRYSTLAELRLADVVFAQEKFSTAIDAYKLFIKFHPMHPQVLDGYAAFRICEGYVKQIPSEWFLVPPSHEMDQSATRQALSELTLFLRRYRQSKYRKKGLELHRATLRQLIAHELYVARFYLDRDKPKATILRLEGVLRRYPGAGVDPEVMLLLGKTYLKMNERVKAKATFSQLVAKYPKDANAAKAQLYLRYLGGR